MPYEAEELTDVNEHLFLLILMGERLEEVIESGRIPEKLEPGRMFYDFLNKFFAAVMTKPPPDISDCLLRRAVKKAIRTALELPPSALVDEHLDKYHQFIRTLNTPRKLGENDLETAKKLLVVFAHLKQQRRRRGSGCFGVENHERSYA